MIQDRDIQDLEIERSKKIPPMVGRLLRRRRHRMGNGGVPASPKTTGAEA